ncbi:MAG: undecaprenyl-diphosphate phosphatase [Desulfohalobiaceae bacterium]
MYEFLAAVILGIVEGVTEFLPISSTGHLILVGNLLEFTGEQVKTFDVVIQLGAILAVVYLYWPRFRSLLTKKQEQKFSGPFALWLLFLTTLPAGLMGLIGYSAIKEHLFAPQPVAWALGIGALGILLVESIKRNPRYQGLDDLSQGLALGIGLFQCLSLWPGFSRAAATIMGGMFLGAERKLAAEYSFISAVPIMFAASAYDIYKSWQIFSGLDWSLLLVGFVVSFFTAILAIKGFIHLLSRFTLRPFAYYRLAMAPLIIIFWGA